jgi:hypothetical protein
VATHLFQLVQNSFMAILDNLLFLAVFNFWGHFEGLNEGFSGSIMRFPIIDDVSNLSLKINLIDDRFPMIYRASQMRDRMPKLRPWEVDTPNYPKRGPQNCWIFIFRG